MALNRKRAGLEWTLGRISHCASVEALEQISQRSSGCPVTGTVQGQVGWVFQQPGLVKDVLAHGRGGGMR